MLLEPDKIYPTYRICKFLMMPSLEVTEGVSVYTSDDGMKPSSIDDMVLDEGIIDNQINSFITVPRWIAVTYSNEDSVAYECGLLTNPFSDKIIKTDTKPEDITIDNKGTLLYLDNNKTILEWK